MPDLNCTEFERRLAEAVEDRLSPEELSADASWQELRVHAQACPECRQLWNDFALLERVLPIWKAQVPPVDLADAVIARWQSENAAPAAQTDLPQKTAGRSPLGILLAAATTALVGLVLFYAPQPTDELPETVPTAEVDSEPQIDQTDQRTENDEAKILSEETEAERDWQALAQDARSAYWALASDTADSFASVRVFVPLPRSDETSTEPDPTETQPTSPWVENLGAGLKPIGEDMGRALEFLRDALPEENSTL